jgi:hypothetical protein
MTFSASEKLDAVEREIAMRRHVYPNRVEARRMTQAFADRQIAIFEAIADDLRAEAQSERLI